MDKCKAAEEDSGPPHIPVLLTNMCPNTCEYYTHTHTHTHTVRGATDPLLLKVIYTGYTGGGGVGL